MIQIPLENREVHCPSIMTPEFCQAIEIVKNSLNELAQEETTMVSLYVFEPLEDDWRRVLNSFTPGNGFGLEWAEPIVVNRQLIAYQAWVIEDNDEFAC